MYRLRVPSTPRAVLAAAALLVLGTSVGAGAAAYDATNSDKVDGKHAVGASATTARAAGKLVAMNRSGKLPSKFIPKVGDSETLDGMDSTAFLAAEGTAADADRVDGLDSSAFLRSDGTATNSDRLGNVPAGEYLRKCQNGSVQGRAEVSGAQASTTTWQQTGVNGATDWICTGQNVLVLKESVGNYEVVFGDQVSGGSIGHGTGNGPLAQASSQDAGKIVSVDGPFQCASGSPPPVYVICYQVSVRDAAGAPVDGSFAITIG